MQSCLMADVQLLISRDSHLIPVLAPPVTWAGLGVGESRGAEHWPGAAGLLSSTLAIVRDPGPSHTVTPWHNDTEKCTSQGNTVSYRSQ